MEKKLDHVFLDMPIGFKSGSKAGAVFSKSLKSDFVATSIVEARAELAAIEFIAEIRAEASCEGDLPVFSPVYAVDPGDFSG